MRYIIESPYFFFEVLVKNIGGSDTNIGIQALSLANLIIGSIFSEVIFITTEALVPFTVLRVPIYLLFLIVLHVNLSYVQYHLKTVLKQEVATVLKFFGIFLWSIELVLIANILALVTKV